MTFDVTFLLPHYVPLVAVSCQTLFEGKKLSHCLTTSSTCLTISNPQTGSCQDMSDNFLPQVSENLSVLAEIPRVESNYSKANCDCLLLNNVFCFFFTFSYLFFQGKVLHRIEGKGEGIGALQWPKPKRIVGERTGRKPKKGMKKKNELSAI